MFRIDMVGIMIIKDKVGKIYFEVFTSKRKVMPTEAVYKLFEELNINKDNIKKKNNKDLT